MSEPKPVPHVVKIKHGIWYEFCAPEFMIREYDDLIEIKVKIGNLMIVRDINCQELNDVLDWVEKYMYSKGFPLPKGSVNIPMHDAVVNYYCKKWRSIYVSVQVEVENAQAPDDPEIDFGRGVLGVWVVIRLID